MCPTEDSTGEEVWRYVQLLDRAGEESATFLTYLVEGVDTFPEINYAAVGSEIGLSQLQMTRLAEYLGVEETQPPEWGEEFEGVTWLHRVRRSDLG